MFGKKKEYKKHNNCNHCHDVEPVMPVFPSGEEENNESITVHNVKTGKLATSVMIKEGFGTGICLDLDTFDGIADISVITKDDKFISLPIDDIAAIGITVFEEHNEDLLNSLDFITSTLRYNYNQMKGESTQLIGAYWNNF